MKILQTLILCLCTFCVYSQTKKDNTANETYLFDKATFTISNASSKAIVNSRVITDPATVTLEDMFFQNTFRKVTVNNGTLLFCTLPDQKDYSVKNSTELVAVKTQKPLKEEKKEVLLKRPQALLGRVEPYSMSLNNGVLTFSVTYLYGDSRYNFPLEGKLILTMIKQK